MISKFTTFGIVLQTLFFGLLYAEIGKAQEIQRVYDVHLNVELKDVNVIEAFSEIERKTDFHFSFDISDIDRNVKINYKKKDISVADVLMEISKEANLKFKQVNNYINVNRNEKKAVQKIEVVIQGREITGKVTSEDDNEGLPGVNVIVKGTSQGTVTDVNGNYILEIPEGNTILVFSSVGFIKEEITVGTQSVVDLIMRSDVTSLDEIVVIGYGEQKKANLTGSVVTVGEADFENRVVSNPVQALQGKVAGLRVTQTTGTPGK